MRRGVQAPRVRSDRDGGNRTSGLRGPGQAGGAGVTGSGVGGVGTSGHGGGRGSALPLPGGNVETQLCSDPIFPREARNPAFTFK